MIPVNIRQYEAHSLSRRYGLATMKQRATAWQDAENGETVFVILPETTYLEMVENRIR